MKVDKKVVMVAVAAFALAWFMSHNTGGGFIPNPFVPEKPKHPFLRAVVKFAKTALWVVAFAEPKPADLSATQHHIVRANVGPDGHELLDHAEGL